MLSKKKSRPIIFDKHPYRWSVTEDGEYVTLAVQRSNVNGQKLEVIIRSIEWFADSITSEPRPITPGLVSKIMTKAIRCGWTPDQSHSPLELSMDENDELEVRRGLPGNFDNH